jgi:hypothetical protein
LSEKRYSVLNKDNDSSVSLLQALACGTAADNVRRTGVLEVLHAALFAALLVVAYSVD